MPDFGESAQEFLSEDLVLRIRGGDGTVRPYVIKCPTARELLDAQMIRYVSNMVAAGRGDGVPKADLQRYSEMSLEDMRTLMLGEDTLNAMIADNISSEDYLLALNTATAFRAGDTAAARRIWSGKAPSPKIPSGKTGAAAKKTRKASTSGTSTRKKSSKR